MPTNSNSRIRLGGARRGSQSPHAIARRRYSKIAPLVEYLSKNSVGSVEGLLAIAATGRGVSTSTLRRWLNAYLKLGLHGLEPAIRNDLGVSRAFRGRFLARILAVEMRSGGMDVVSIWRALVAQWPSLYPGSDPPSYNTIVRYLKSIFRSQVRP